MKEFYYQIKGKRDPKDPKREDGLWGGVNNWVYPAIFVGKVTAEDKKKAQIIIEEEYGKKFPLRVLQKDLEANEFLLSIKEITEKEYYIKALFEERKCDICQRPFTLIEKYNDSHNFNNSHNWCSHACQNESYKIREYAHAQQKQEALNISDYRGEHNPLIYKITNKIDDNRCYIGKTTQVFTLRWYQHFFQYGNNKFHDAVKKSKFIDWTFEVIEIVEIPNTLTRLEEIEGFVLERETFYMNKYNSISHGYNSLASKAGDINQIAMNISE